ncbi:hypothetical protein [Virgibacillus kimchii]
MPDTYTEMMFKEPIGYKNVKGDDFIFLQLYAIIGFYLLPVYGIIFCLNLVSLIKKVHDNKVTEKHTIWMTVAFILIITTIGALAGLHV